jgi:CRISPR-associated protein Csm3
MVMKQLIKKIKISTVVELLSGLHVGGNGDSVEIGGIDNPVIRASVKDNQPYIPGSSIKGKMRCLLEQIKGSTKVGGNPEINNLFGYSQTNQPSKIIVRDAYLTKESAAELKNCDNLDAPYTEGKWENVIDRVKGTAEHPRQTERIPAGVSFNVEFVINVWDDDKEVDLVALLKEGIKALENDYLGGSGSRGYGQVKFGELKAEEITFEK